MARFFTLMICLSTAVPVVHAGSKLNFDHGFKFILGDQGFTPAPPIPAALSSAGDDGSSFCNFGTNISGTQCYGFTAAPAPSADECAASCCLDPSCTIWQFDTSDPLSQGCWQGNTCAQNTSNKDWVSFVRDPAPPGPPSPLGPPCINASLPCAPAFDDSTWRDVSAPHDFIVEGAPSPNCDRGHGYLCLWVLGESASFEVTFKAPVHRASLPLPPPPHSLQQQVMVSQDIHRRRSAAG